MIEKIFISYTYSDFRTVHLLRDILRKEGLISWPDHSDIQPEESISEAIGRWLRECDLVVPIINIKDLDTPSLFFHLGAALSMGKDIVPVMVYSFDPNMNTRENAFQSILLRLPNFLNSLFKGNHVSHKDTELFRIKMLDLLNQYNSKNTEQLQSIVNNKIKESNTVK